MRITIIGPAYPLRGGIAHHVFQLHKELTARAHSVQVVSYRKLYPGILFPGKTEIDTSRVKLDAGALAILTPLNPLTWRRAFKQVKAFSPDVVIFEWWQPFFGPLVGVLARTLRRSGVACIVECHNIFPHERGPLDRVLVRFALSAADQLITHSSKDRDDLLAVVPGKEVIISPLPGVSEFSRPSDNRRGGRTILFFGKVRKYKGLDLLLTAMPRILAKADCKLIVAGEFYDSIEKYRRLIRTHDLGSRVHIDDRYVPNEEVAGIFDSADVLVLPYVSASQSGVARIALTSGLPVIASRTGGLSETIIDEVNGLLFPPGDRDALARQVVRYFANNLGPILSENIRSGNPEDSTRGLGDVIEEIIRRRRSDSGDSAS